MSTLYATLQLMFTDDVLPNESDDRFLPALLARSITIAAYAHRNQVDKGGKAYITHPLRLMMRLRTDDHKLMILAVLHDVIEDSEITQESLMLLGFTKELCDDLNLLAHDKSMSYDEYIDRIGTKLNPTTVKLEDLRDNSDITRMKGLREKDFGRLAKYHTAFQYLSQRLKVLKNVNQ